jgi:hypothetical protein
MPNKRAASFIMVVGGDAETVVGHLIARQARITLTGAA